MLSGGFNIHVSHTAIKDGRARVFPIKYHHQVCPTTVSSVFHILVHLWHWPQIDFSIFSKTRSPSPCACRCRHARIRHVPRTFYDRLFQLLHVVTWFSELFLFLTCCQQTASDVKLIRCQNRAVNKNASFIVISVKWIHARTHARYMQEIDPVSLNSAELELELIRRAYSFWFIYSFLFIYSIWIALISTVKSNSSACQPPIEEVFNWCKTFPDFLTKQLLLRVKRWEV